MKIASTLLLASAALLASQASAQRPGGGNASGHTVTTTSDFAVLSNVGRSNAFDSEAVGTSVRRGLAVRAVAGTSRSERASATTTVARTRAGVTVRESGTLANSDPNQGARAGTSADAPGTRNPSQGAHSIQLAYPGIAAGTNAIVDIRWYGNASTGAAATGEVDVDGDGQADFSAVADGNRAGATIQVVAGRAGVVVDISTSGGARLAADGRAAYRAHLSVSVREGTLPTSCTFTNFGRPCGADLNGTVGRNLDLSLDVSNAAADAFGILMIGDQATTPTPLPVGTCSLLVDPNRRWSGRLFRTDANGDANISLRSPRMALTTSFQALVFTGNRRQGTRNVDASNGVELTCQ